MEYAIKTSFSHLDFILTISTGLFVLLRRASPHWNLWLALVVYWILGGIVQDIFNNNSIYVGVWTAKRTKTIWPIIISALMVLTVINSVWFAVYLEVNVVSSTLNRRYQDITFVLFYISLITLFFRNLRTVNDARTKWIFS